MELYRHKTALLVDDSYIDNLISRKILENNSFAENIIVIESPDQAIDFIRESILFQLNIPDVLFLDITQEQQILAVQTLLHLVLML